LKIKKQQNNCKTFLLAPSWS